MEAVYQELTKTWCDALLKHQVTDIKMPGIHGGILCPACARIHGRCFEAIHPLLYLADTLKEEKYLDAAVRLFDWSGHVSCEDGSWLNETDSQWKGTTVFGALALGQAILFHGALLGEATLGKWRQRLHEAAQYLYDNIVYVTGNVNYPVVCSAALAVSGIVLENKEFKDRGRALAHGSLRYFTQNGLLFGEGHPADGVSPKGCRPVDLGYNVEESLPGLALYATLTHDDEILEAVTKAMTEHLAFMLPDGGWDDSWGTRNYKWTWWGSRTSEGCQGAYGLLGNRSPMFAEAALRNAELLKSCTMQGVLLAGSYKTAKQPPCIHHTFCHAKALATVLDAAPIGMISEDRVKLPHEEASGVREYPEIATWLAAKGPWRATVTAYDWEYMRESHASGGALSLLWHELAGQVLVASLSKYTLQEPGNMQIPRGPGHECLTARIELFYEGKLYSNINDLGADVSFTTTEAGTCFETSGQLVDGEQKSPHSGEVRFKAQYLFTDAEVRITASFTTMIAGAEPVLIVPVISKQEEAVSNGGNSIAVKKARGILVVEVDAEMSFPETAIRIYNLVPGLEAVPLRIPMHSGRNSSVAIRFCAEAE